MADPSLKSEVKIDFASAATFAKTMQAAAASVSQIRKDFAAIERSIKASGGITKPGTVPHNNLQPTNRNPSGGGGGGATAGEKAALAASGAVGSAFFYRSAGLANPAAMSRFHDAIDDATAVIGHKLIPIIDWLTRRIRSMGDWLANHETAAKVIAYGGAGLAGLAAVGGAMSLGGMALRGGSGLLKGGAGLLGYGKQAAAEAAGTVAGNILSPKSAGTAASEAKKRAALKAGVQPSTLAKSAGVGAMATAGPIGIGLAAATIAETYMGDELDQARLQEMQGKRSSGFGGLIYRSTPGWTTRNILTPIGLTSSQEDLKKQASSMGAASRPAEYSDILGSVMGMRQSILSGQGLDPNEKTAENTGKMAAAMEDFLKSQQRDSNTGGEFGKPSERSTRGRS